MDSELVDRVQTVKAVEALKAYVAKLQEQRKNLFTVGEAENVHLQFSFKKVSLQHKTVNILLPHSPVDETTAICLFTSDVDRNDRDYTVTVDHYRELLKSHGIRQTIEIIPLKQLKLEYKEYEAKQNLLGMYDVFLADARIVRLLPSKLGKHFYLRKRHPLPMNLTSKNLQKECTQVLSTSRCTMAGRGSSGQMTVGRLSQSVDQITDNVMFSIQRLAASIPGGKENIRSLHIKAQDTLAIPVYVSFGSKDKVELPKRKRERKDVEPEDITTVKRAKVQAMPGGEICIIPDKLKDSIANKDYRTSKKPMQRRKKVSPNKTSDASGSQKKSKRLSTNTVRSSKTHKKLKVSLAEAVSVNKTKKKRKADSKKTGPNKVVEKSSKKKLPPKDVAGLGEKKKVHDAVQPPAKKKKVPTATLR